MRSTFRVPFALLTLAGVLALPACDDDPEEVEQEPDVAFLELTFGGQTIRIDENGDVTGGTLTFPVGQTTVVARWLKADGSVEPLADEDEFELRIVPSNATIATFTNLGGFDGRITGVVAGQTLTGFQLFHIEEQHEDFEVNATITVQ
jgi:hypothetical protein